jgi:hypothetical protein
MDSLKYVNVPGYSALILRRTHRELVLAGALLDRSHEWLDSTDARWSGSDSRWTFPSGATLEFGYFDRWEDRSRYQSAEWNRVYFDELTHFPENWYRFMFTRIRRLAGFAVPSAMRGATNPGGVGHRWVYERFIQKPAPGCAFVPATFRDNPSVDQSDYERQLDRADPITRRQMLGEWIQDGIGNVYAFDEARNVIDETPASLCKRLGIGNFVLGLDFGVTSPNGYVVLGWATGERRVYVLEAFKRAGQSVDEIHADIVPLQAKYPFTKIVGDVGGLGKGIAEELIRRKSLPIEPAEKVNKYGYVRLLNGVLSRGELVVCAPTCQPLIDEWLRLPWDEKGEHEAPGHENHCADAALYGWRATFAYLEEPIAPKPRTMIEKWEREERELERQLTTEESADPWERIGY